MQLDGIGSKYGITPIHNHLDNHKEITTKTGLVKSLRAYYTSSEQALLNSYQIHDSIPTSFIIAAQVEDFEYQSLLKRFHDLENLHSNKERTPVKHCLKNMWLIKPAALNQGKGIEICKNIKEIVRSLRSKPMNSLWLVQKYIEKPLLLNGRKFDIRVWALVTGKKEVFYYKKGYIRTSSVNYDLEGKDTYIHLTNNCLQQFGDMYGVFEKGNTLSYSQFQSYLDSEFAEYKVNMEEHLVPRIKDLIIDTYLSSKKQLHKSKKSNVFELLGYDFLIDEDFRVWLIEVNTNPYLGVPNEYIEELLPNMLDDLLDITVDSLYPPSVSRTRLVNDFELIYCENGSAFSKESKAVNKRQNFNTNIYPILALSQLPLCRQCIAHRYEEDLPKSVQKDLLQSFKQMLDNDSNLELSDYLEITDKILYQLIISYQSPPEHCSNAIEALRILVSSNRVTAICESKNLKKLVGVLNQDFTYDLVKRSLLEIFIQASKLTSIRKLLAHSGFIEVLVYNCLQTTDNNIKDLCVRGLITLSSNPDKGIYVPGKSQDIKYVKEKMITHGGLVCLLHFSLLPDMKYKNQIIELFENDVSIDDWKRLTRVINDNINGFGDFPFVLGETKLNIASTEIENIINNKVIDINRKKILQKKQKEDETRKAIEMEENMKKLEEEKKHKLEIYLKKKSQEMKKQKIEMIKLTKLERENTEKQLQEKRLAIIMKKRIEEKKNSSLRKSAIDEREHKRLEKARKKLNEKNRKKLLREWLRFKCQIEKSILRQQSKQRLKSDINKILTSFKEKSRDNSISRSAIFSQEKAFPRYSSQKLLGKSFAKEATQKIRRPSLFASSKINFYSKSFTEIKFNNIHF